MKYDANNNLDLYALNKNYYCSKSCSTKEKNDVEIGAKILSVFF